MTRIILLLIIVVCLAGCAINTRYVSYTPEQYPPKEKYYFVSIYPENQKTTFAQPYHIIGRVEASGHISDGVNPDILQDKARAVARARGGDAIINARTEGFNYGGVDYVPGHCGFHWCYPPAYIPYRDTLLRFRGEVAAFTPAENKE